MADEGGLIFMANVKKCDRCEKCIDDPYDFLGIEEKK